MTDLVDKSGSIVWQLWTLVRSAKPLTQCITNFVSMEIMASTLLAAGASPAMVGVGSGQGRGSDRRSPGGEVHRGEDDRWGASSASGTGMTDGWRAVA